MQRTSGKLQVLITPGTEDPDRAVLGLHTALVAALSAAEVTVFFTLRGTRWACAKEEGSGAAEEIAELIAQLLDAGATLECCSACMEKHCAEAATPRACGLREGIRPAGLAAMVRRAAEGASTLSF